LALSSETIPQSMTFENGNLDILSGISAPIIYFFAFRNEKTNRLLLIVWNTLALILLLNIVVTAIAAFPSPLQQIAFEQPNRAVMYFPYVWLPSIIVPIVLSAI
jgi:FtsH-binding integral membrane protein